MLVRKKPCSQEENMQLEENMQSGRNLELEENMQSGRKHAVRKKTSSQEGWFTPAGSMAFNFGRASPPS